MTYTLEWLKTFDGQIDILNVKMDCLANTIEKNVSQYQIYLSDRYGELS